MKRSKRYLLPALLTLTILATLSFLVYGVVGATSAPVPRSTISGEMVPALQGHTPVGATDGQQMLSLTVSLRLANEAGLQGLINAQNDRNSPLYHEYITPQQFTAEYAPTQASVDAVTSYLSSQGLTVQSVAANRLSIKVRGTVATVEHAFNVSISNYSLSGHIFYAPSSEPSVPSSLAGLILSIGGLDNVSQVHRASDLAPMQTQTPNFGPEGGDTPSELRTAYDMNSLVNSDSGSGQTVAIAELDGYVPNDINVYRSEFGLGSTTITNELVDGATGAVTGDGAIEVELDMEVVSAIAPAAAQEIYIGPNTLLTTLFDVFNQIVSDDTAQVVSNSWDLCEADTGSSLLNSFDTVFQEGAAQGQAFFAASGDSGAFDCFSDPTLDTSLDVGYPASDPNVVGVGGTTLEINSNGTRISETAWSCPASEGCFRGPEGEGGGGGVSGFFAQPAYQTGPGVNNSNNPNHMREVPDVSAEADPNEGYAEFCTDPNSCGAGWFFVGGTSGAAPLWAGIAADLNEYLISQNRPTLGSASAALYWLFNTSHPHAPYHDITSGNNLHYAATKGYDLATGIGTPDVWNIARDFAAAAPAVTPTSFYLATTTGTDPAPQTLTITNSGFAPYNWSLNLPSGITATATSGTAPANGSSKVTLTFALGNTPQTFNGTITVNDQAAIIPTISVPVTVVEADVSTTWYFAEGYTGGSFSEYLTLANPNSVPAHVQVEYLLGSGAPLTKTYTVAANARSTVFVNGVIGSGAKGKNVSMVVTSDQPIVAERPMYFDFTGLPGLTIPGGTDVLGATSLNTNFDFGYLDTTAKHATYLTVLNQNDTAMTVNIQYFAANGTMISRTHSVAANSRGTVFVNSDVSAGTYSALVTLSEPGLVERPLYLVDSQTNDTGAADVVGVAQPQTTWDFAEGYTSSTFSERYILSNPTTTTAHALVTFFLSNGTTKTVSETLGAGRQVIVSANSVLGSNNVNNSAQVTSDAPILAERFISFRYVGPAGPTGANASIPGASDVLGASAAGQLFYFAEGYSGATFGEYLTIENPQASAATVQVTFLPSNGAKPVVKVYTIAAKSRFTLFTNSVMPNTSFSMVVESNIPIVAERPMYFVFNGGPTGGSDVVGYQPIVLV